MNSTYYARREQLEHYFDRTAAEAWSRLTSDVPVGRIRATVRAGRDEMRATLLAWLPDALDGRRLLDAGCGTGALAVAAAARGAEVLAVDLAGTLLELARERTPHDVGRGTVEFRVADMLDAALGEFEHVVAMDSLVHYHTTDVVRALAAFAPRTRGSILFTIAPRTALLAAMHAVGRLLPRGHRAPAIEPVAPARLLAAIAAEPALVAFAPGRMRRIGVGFYTSEAIELVRR